MKKYPYRLEVSTLFLYMQIGTGISMLLYLVMHTTLLVSLLFGEESFSSVITFFSATFWVVLEQVAMVGILFHLFNGLRMVALMFGKWCNQDDDLQGVVILATLFITAFHYFLPVIREFV